MTLQVAWRMERPPLLGRILPNSVNRTKRKKENQGGCRRSSAQVLKIKAGRKQLIMIYLVLFLWELKELKQREGKESYMSYGHTHRPSCKDWNWHCWHLALRKPVSQAGLWSIISLSGLALVQLGRKTSCI